MPGTYTVSVVAPAGYVATMTGQGTVATDSNASPSGTTPSFLQSGESDQTIDFGFYEPVKIGNWEPKNYTNKYLGPITLQTALAQFLVQQGSARPEVRELYLDGLFGSGL